MEKLVVSNQQLTSIKKNLIEGLTIASAAKGSATYYHGKDEQNKAIKEAINKLYDQSKELPLIIANQKGSTGKFIQEVILKEFESTYVGGSCNIVNPQDWYDNGISDKALLGALKNLDSNGITYVLRLFTELKTRGINNERARKIALGYVLGHPNIEFNVLKYRNKIKTILKTVYGQKRTSILLNIAQKYVSTNVFESDKDRNIVNSFLGKYYAGDVLKGLKILLFVFKKDKQEYYNSNDFPLLAEYYNAKVDVTNVTRAPEEVVLGLLSSKDHPQYEAMWSTELKREATKKLIRSNTEVTSVNQQVRQTKSNKKLGVEKAVDLSKATDYLALYKTGYENKFTNELKDAINELAEKNKINDFPYENIGIVMDSSASMTGHKVESKNTPRAIANFTSRVLGKSAKKTEMAITSGEITDLASAFIDILKHEDVNNQYDAIFMISDGYENSYEGLTNEVVSIWLKETGRSTPIFQISPITGAEMGANVRTLGNDIIKMAVNSPMAIMSQINGRLLEVDTKRWLERQLLSLEASNVRRYKKNNVEV